MNNKRNILVVLSVMIASIFLVAMPSVSAACDCHNVGVITTIEPTRLHMGMKNAPDAVTFKVIIYNSGNYVEEGISLKIVEQRTGIVLYNNPNQVFLLPSGEDAKFDVIVPVDRLSGYDRESLENGGWINERYIVTTFQKGYSVDCWWFDNYDYPILKVKPYFRKA